MDYIANVENSEIDVSGIRTVLVQGDSTYPIIRFVLDPSLTGLSWRVRGTYTGTNIAVLSPEITPTESASAVTLDWSVSSDFTTYDGDMQLVLVGANETGTTVVKAIAEITIQKDWSVGTMQTVTLNLFEQLMAQASEAISHYPQIGDNGNWFVWDVDSGAFVDTGETALGDPTQWYTGTSITGVDATPTAFPLSGIAMTRLGDMYLNETTANVYRCTLAGNAATALWSYRTNISGEIVDGSVTNVKLANMADNTIKGNVSGGAAAPSDLTAAQVMEMISAMPYDATSTNLLINGNFAVNQLAKSGTVTLAAGAYGHDMWKAGASGCTYTFATSANVTTLTISAGSLIQIIEGLNLQSGTVSLSWTGTAQGKIGAGSFGASGITGTAVGGTNLNIELNTGTVSNVQLNYGAVALPYVTRSFADELRLSQRYYEKSYNLAVAPGTVNNETGIWFTSVLAVATANGARWPLGKHPVFKVRKRTTPTVTLYTYEGTSGQWATGGANRACSVGANESGFYITNATGGSATPTEGEAYGHWVADARM